jgi:hypothetical protein
MISISILSKILNYSLFLSITNNTSSQWYYYKVTIVIATIVIATIVIATLILVLLVLLLLAVAIYMLSKLQ